MPFPRFHCLLVRHSKHIFTYRRLVKAKRGTKADRGFSALHFEHFLINPSDSLTSPTPPCSSLPMASSGASWIVLFAVVPWYSSQMSWLTLEKWTCCSEWIGWLSWSCCSTIMLPIGRKQRRRAARNTIGERGCQKYPQELPSLQTSNSDQTLSSF